MSTCKKDDVEETIVERLDGLVLYRSTRTNIVQDVKVNDYKLGLRCVVKQAEDIVLANKYSQSNLKQRVLGHISLIKDLLKSDLIFQEKGLLVRAIWEIHRPNVGLGLELNFIISFFMRTDIEDESRAS